MIGSSSNCHTHHIDYRRIGNEQFADLIVICGGCHDDLHQWIERVARKHRKTRRDVMDRIRPVMIRRLLQLHDFWRPIARS